LTLEGEQSMQTFWKKKCRELYRRTTLTEAQTRETTDQVLDETMWEEDRPWEEKWESLKVNESKMTEQELDDEDIQARFWRRRLDGFYLRAAISDCLLIGFIRATEKYQLLKSDTMQIVEHLRRKV
jgi:hypothetical protein